MEAYDDNQDGKIDIREVCASLSALSVVQTRCQLTTVLNLATHVVCAICRSLSLSLYPFTHLPFAVRDILAEIRRQIAF